jgi:hypothetical protein
MKALKILFVLCIMLGLALPASSQGKGKQVVRPMKGSFYAVDVPPYGNPQLLTLSGNATHLGNFTGTMDFYKPPVFPKFYNEGTLVAANGDEIYFWSYPVLGIIGMNPYPYGTLSGKVILDGGSGRFTDCAGEINITGVFDMNANCASWTAEGWIKY